MAESSLEFRRSLDLGSDNMTDTFCEPCHEVAGEIKPFSDHNFVDKSTKPKTQPKPQTQPQNLCDECLLHHDNTLQSFCLEHSQLCCNVCLTINHQGCLTEEISRLARNIQDSKELINLNKKLTALNKGFNDTLSQTAANEIFIKKNYQDAMNEMKELRDEFERLMAKTEAQIEKVKDEDFKKIEKVSSIVTEQINSITLNLDMLQEKGEAKMMFISMKQAKSQFNSLEETLGKLQKDNSVREYKFEPNGKLKTLLQDLNVLGELSFQRPKSSTVSYIQIKQQKAKRPTSVKDITVKFKKEERFGLCCSLLLPNNQILFTEFKNKKLKLICINNNKIISSLSVSGNPFDLTKVAEYEVAVTVELKDPHDKIQFISVSKNTLSMGREISVRGQCKGISHNENDQTLIVTYIVPVKVEILDMAGTVIKRLDKDSMRNPLFDKPLYVALCLNMTDMYITDYDRHTVTLMTMDGDVKAVYMDKRLQKPYGICVHKSGLVYVVGRNSDSVHQLDPLSGKFKRLLSKKDGLDCPQSISYCHFEDKMYIGMAENSVLKVFQMK